MSHTFDELLEGLEVRGVRIPNRLALAPVNTGFAAGGGEVTDRLVTFHQAVAQGGVGLTTVGACAVCPTGRVNAGTMVVDRNKQSAGMARLFGAISAEGSVPALQLVHAGRQTSRVVVGTRPVAPSAIACPIKGEMPRELTRHDIHEIRVEFADAAERAVSAGAQIVELHGAHGYLLGQFVSPYTNARTDEYGGSLEDRLRFPLEVVAAVRKAVGDRVPVIYRHSVDEFVAGGISLGDSLNILPRLVEAGIDVISVSAGIYASRDKIIPRHSCGPAVYAFLGRAVKDRVAAPVIVAGNIWSLAIAQSIVREGCADMVALARALIADPLLVAKTLAGRADDIARCTGCGICDYGPRGERWVRCPQNPRL